MCDNASIGMSDEFHVFYHNLHTRVPHACTRLYNKEGHSSNHRGHQPAVEEKVEVITVEKNDNKELTE